VYEALSSARTDTCEQQCAGARAPRHAVRQGGGCLGLSDTPGADKLSEESHVGVAAAAPRRY
jgi:hypothetical protein